MLKNAETRIRPSLPSLSISVGSKKVISLQSYQCEQFFCSRFNKVLKNAETRIRPSLSISVGFKKVISLQSYQSE